jgi:hypothetical protein
MLLNFKRCEDKIKVKIGGLSVSFICPEENVWASQYHSFRRLSYDMSIVSLKAISPDRYIYSFLLQLSEFFCFHKFI